MSINHYASELSEAHWWSHYVMDSSARTSSSDHKPIVPNSTGTFWLGPNHLHRPLNPATASAAGPMFGFNLNNEDDEELVDEQAADDRANTPRELELAGIPKEPLFEKPLTPSDVGKLNRLVIPKQHAEKYFPLNGGGGAESGENGLLLSFEDEVGKAWRFRYSYWNSSQSYVLTKGWSRFVKEKRLDAGDIVVFARHRGDAGRLFIGWRRRNSVGGGQDNTTVTQPATAVASGGGWSRAYHSGHPNYPRQNQGPSSLHHQLPDFVHAGSVVQNQTTGGSGNSKRLRLFGVNLECQAEESDPSTPVGSPISSQGQAHHHHQPAYQQYYSNHVDMISFSGGGGGGGGGGEGDVYRQG